MTNPYTKKRLKLFNEDCLQILKTIPDNSIDLILTDPPYNIGKYSTGNITLPNRSDLNNDIATWDLDELDPKDLIHDFKRILKPTGNIFIFTSYNMIGKWHANFDDEFDTFQFFIWHKTNPAPKIYKNGFLNSCEMIACMWNKGHTWNFTKQNEMHNFFESPICMGKERLKDPKHPAQKPVKLLEHIIRIASNENEIVFDPFMGVASTAIASLKLDRMFAGCEIDEIYYNASIKRIQDYRTKNNNHSKLISGQNINEDEADYLNYFDW
jgi:site-specific DNA-methyltransferase (adenine-specific)/modification methylase